MNWTPCGLSAELEFQGDGRQFLSNFQCQAATDFPSKHFNLSQQRQNDEVFINNFITKKQTENHPKRNTIKISEARNILLRIIGEKEKLEKSVLNLDINDEKFNLKWDVFVSELNQLNEKILTFDSNVKAPLMSALKKRLKKREMLKKKKEKFREMKKFQKEKIKEKHKIIDKLLNEKSEEVEMVKHEAGLKRQADSVLHEVQKKKYEAKKMLNLLVALAKLRELRSKEEEKQGGYCSKQLTDTFNKVMMRFQNLWEKQLEVYKLEEKGLKIMLEENTIPHKKESKLETNILQWEKVLFADFSDNENEKLLTLADTDIQTLIQVRRDWDKFLTSKTALMASGIPLGWVLPPETEDEHWKAFIKSSKNTSL